MASYRSSTLASKLAHEEQEWQWFFPLSHGAWDRDGGVIVESLPENEAFLLIEAHGKVVGLERLVALAQAKAPPGSESAKIEPSVSEVLVPLSALIAEAKRYLHRLAYPDARETEADPDDELAWRRARRRKRWSGLPDSLRD